MQKIYCWLAVLIFLSIIPLSNLKKVQAASPSLVVAEVKVGGEGTGTTDQELVSVYNNSKEPINITNWCIQYSPASDGVGFSSLACFTDPSPTITLWLPGNSYAVISSKEFALKQPLLLADSTYSGGKISGVSGHIRIVDKGLGEVDRVGYDAGFGSSNRALHPEGEAALFTPNLTDNRVFQRSKALLLIDTDNNLADFTQLPMVALPLSGVFEQFDACVNVEGVQSEIPAGYISDDSGVCSPYEEINSCFGVIINEVLPNPAGADGGSEFIELHNPTGLAISLAGCRLESSSSSNNILEFKDQELKPGQFKAYYDLTLPNSSGGSVYLIDSDDSELAQTDYPGGMEDDAAWALSGDKFVRTFTPTPNTANKILASKPLEPCPAGQFRNGETNRCNNIASVAGGLAPCNADQERNAETNRCRKINSSSSSLKPCAPNQTRNPETNRCRNIASLASVLKPCAADQFRNPDTNRCKKSKTSDLKPCKENQERNPETNRCRNVAGVLGAIDGNNPKDVQAPAASARGWLLAIGGVAGVLLYAVWEWRNEALLAAINLRQKFTGIT